MSSAVGLDPDFQSYVVVAPTCVIADVAPEGALNCEVRRDWRNRHVASTHLTKWPVAHIPRGVEVIMIEIVPARRLALEVKASEDGTIVAQSVCIVGAASCNCTEFTLSDQTLPEV